ncbi:MAG TPA: ROK family protein [Desulfobaccales bacterium]|jgi:glucokinase|nr:ROK family protein [Desulfobaccales bacterium]
MGQETWAIGVDLGGTKGKAAVVDASGKIHQELQHPTDVQGGPDRIIADLVEMVQQLQRQGPPSPAAGLGVGVAGQINADTGVVRFSPNLNWHEVPFRDRLQAALDMPVVVTNDVRAATWGEWLHGAGQGIDDLICLFIGTGVGGGVVSGGRLLTGCTNTAGELGHMTIDLNGPICTCGNRGCLEALAGGWGIARRARMAIDDAPAAGVLLFKAAGLHEPVASEDITARMVADAARAGDPLALLLVDEAARALIAGAVTLVNAFNPCRLILGGGVIKGLPALIERIDKGIRRYALNTASEGLQVLPGQLKNDAGVVGAAALAIRSFGT